MDFTHPHPSACMAELLAAAGAYQGSLPGRRFAQTARLAFLPYTKLLVVVSLITTFLLKPHDLRSLTLI